MGTGTVLGSAAVACGFESVTVVTAIAVVEVYEYNIMCSSKLIQNLLAKRHSHSAYYYCAMILHSYNIENLQFGIPAQKKKVKIFIRMQY